MRGSYPDAPPRTPPPQPSRGYVTNIRIGYEHPDTLITYPDAWFLSRTNAGGLAPPIDGLLTPPRASSIPAQHTDNLSACTGARSRSAAKDGLAHRFAVLRSHEPCGACPRRGARLVPHPRAPRAPFCCAARPRTMRRMPQTRRTPGPAPTRPSRHAPLARPLLVPTTRAHTARIQNAPGPTGPGAQRIRLRR